MSTNETIDSFEVKPASKKRLWWMLAVLACLSTTAAFFLPDAIRLSSIDRDPVIYVDDTRGVAESDIVLTSGKVELDKSDVIATIQQTGITTGKSTAVHWGTSPGKYVGYSTHSNHLIPVYTWGAKDGGKGLDLNDYTGVNSIYRSEAKINELFDAVTQNTVNPTANYMDQTDIYRIQRAAIEAGKKHVFLVVFDGMSWQSTRAAAIAKSGQAYSSGRGAGLFFLEEGADSFSQFGLMVTSPFGNSAKSKTSKKRTAGKASGGYCVKLAGDAPWAVPFAPEYLKGTAVDGISHMVTDSAASMTSMTCGVKTFNGAINLKHDGSQAESIAHFAQKKGYAVGSVTSVHFADATPAATYAHSNSRGDQSSIAKDMLGLKSSEHPAIPLPGLDVVMGTGFAMRKEKKSDGSQVLTPSASPLSDADLQAADIANGGNYVKSFRSAGVAGRDGLMKNANLAIEKKKRLLALYGGARLSHLPYQTASGDYQPVRDLDGSAETYSRADLFENPKLVDMTEAAINVLDSKGNFWLMVEAGDVDKASHKNNIDNMIGAIYSGDEAVRKIVTWVNSHGGWKDSVLIVTSDHAHYLQIDDPAQLARAAHLAEGKSTLSH